MTRVRMYALDWHHLKRTCGEAVSAPRYFVGYRGYGKGD
jgi:hypothetical protein